MAADSTLTLYIATDGQDRWSGRFSEPLADQSDGPFATIERARDAIRELKSTAQLPGSVTVLLRGGRYFLDKPIDFTPEDSGPITYRAYPGEEAILDGGQPLGGWQVREVRGRTTWVTDIPEARRAQRPYRQLFVNGERRRRPRLPRQGFYWIEHVDAVDLERPMVSQLFQGSDRFRAAPGDIQPWRNLNDVEVVAIHYWIEERLPIESFDPQTRIVQSSRCSTFCLRDDVGARYAKYYVENVADALSEPGEWYLDRSEGRLYYLPLPGEEPATAAAYLGGPERLLRLIGNADEGQLVEFLRFVDLRFEHAECDLPLRWSPQFDESAINSASQRPHAAAPQAAANVPGAVYLEGARNCAIEDCRLAHLGGYAIELGPGCHANRIIGNHLVDLGGGGVKIDGANAAGSPRQRTGNNRITDNTISGGGRIFHSAVGVLSIHSFGNLIAHNEITDLYYSGISCGWVWGYADNVSHNNRIEKNRIHDIGHGLLSDMGGIYTLGVQPGTVIRGNVIDGVEKCNYGGWGIYLDEGSSHILVEDNLCYNTSSQGFNQHYGRENLIRNNIFAFGREGQASLSRPEQHNSFTFAHNLVISNGQPAFVGRRLGDLSIGGFRSDLNLFWDASGEPITHANGRYATDGSWLLAQRFTHADWQGFGQDRHSILADPRFSDWQKGDFSLADDSPAREIGFRPIDFSDVGPRPPEQRDR